MAKDKRLGADDQKLWDEYCGFLNLGLKDYMYIQNRLFLEQIKRWSSSEIGKKMLKEKEPQTVEEFRSVMPLTTYEDYSNILLARQKEMLPGEPLVWIQTTWEGGLRPIKLAPYTREMLDIYRHNVISIMILGAAKKKNDINLRLGDAILYGGAPLPYATGLVPSLLNEKYKFTWLPDSDEYATLSFSERIKKGFEFAHLKGIDYFFGLGSVANYITESFSKKGTSGKRRIKISPKIAFRYIRAKYISKRDGKPILPKDIFKIKGFISSGTDAKCYKEKLGAAWGITPIEIAAGTESTCIGTETWERNGMVFFPDACFYEFIPESEMMKNLDRPSYKPKTCLIDEVNKDQNYELVISVFKGGVFARYRIGDVYRCVSAGGNEVPRFTFVDRVPWVIDIAGFTRITESSINNIISLSKLNIGDWFARKEYSDGNCPYLHVYAEIKPNAYESDVLSMRVLHEHMTIYFKSFDSDYEDLKKLLDIDPLKITILKRGTIKKYESISGSPFKKINPSEIDVISLLKLEKGNSKKILHEEANIT